MATHTCSTCLSPVPANELFCANCGQRQPSGAPFDPNQPQATLPLGSYNTEQTQALQPPALHSSEPTKQNLVPLAPTAQGPATPWLNRLALLGGLMIAIGLYYAIVQPQFNQSNSPTAISNSDYVANNEPTARPTITPLPIIEANEPPTTQATLAGRSNIILEDTFSTKAEGWPEGPTESKSGSYAYVNGNAYQISVDKSKHILWTTTNESYDNVEIQIDITARSGPLENAAGLTIREQANDSFYVFQASPDGTYSFRRFDKQNPEDSGETIILVDWTFNQAINTGLNETNRLRVSAIGSNFQLYINGQLVNSVIDSTYSSGAMGYNASTFKDGNSVMEFDNLQIIQR